MEKLYYRIPYVKTFEAEIMSCVPGKGGHYLVTLSRTGFYPEGGGQPADHGKIGEAHVLDVHEKGEAIVHETDGPVEEGSTVFCSIDWQRRFGHMQNHSGEHILSGLIHKRYGYDNVGFHMGKDEVTVDFNGILTMDQVEEIETETNRLIYENIPILEKYPSQEELSALEYRSKKALTGTVRIIEIPGGDVCACCGTHVVSTGEIGIVKVTGLIHYKGGVRISMVCGFKALEDYRDKQRAVTELSVMLSAKPEMVVGAVERLKEESGKKDGKLNRLYQELFAAKLSLYPESCRRLVVFEPELTPVLLRQYCTMLYEQKKGSAVLVCSGEDGGYQYAMGSASEDMRALSRVLNGQLNGRGGGSTLMAQGTFMASKKAIFAAFTNIPPNEGEGDQPKVKE